MKPFQLTPLQVSEVLINTALSLMSTGTENIVFNRLLEPAGCAQVYGTVNRERARTMGVVFDWREEA